MPRSICVIAFFFASFPVFARIDVRFAPGDRLDRLVFRSLAAARVSAHIASYTMSPEFFASCRRTAAANRLDLKIVLENPVRGIPPGPHTYRLYPSKRTLHAKFAVLDNRAVIAGSSNFTDDGLVRDENNLLFIADPAVADVFEEAFSAIWDGKLPSSSYVRRDFAVFFSPTADCEGIIRNVIRRAKKSIRFAAFTFTSDMIAEDLCRVGLRGVKISGIFDRDQASRYGEKAFLSRFPFRVKYDSFVNAIHDKWFLVDDSAVVTGSYNFTETARRNIETLMIVSDPAVVERYRRRFRYLWLWY